jgi:protein SCO1/2
MYDQKLSFFAVIIIAVIMGGCSSGGSGPPVINDLSNASYELINQDSARVNFAKDLKGKYTVLSFVYTHCPYMCRLITANMVSIQRKLGKTPDVQFVEVTFDPRRDTPSRLRKYMHRYKVNTRNFMMFTGDSLTIDSVMKAANIKYFVNKRDTTEAGIPQYFFKHTNRIDVLDKKARVRFAYPGSAVSADTVVQDLNKLRSNQQGKSSAQKASLSPDALQGYKIAKRNGCFNCHTTNGRSKSGPTFKDLYGHQVTLKDGSAVAADSSYIIQSLNHPDAKIAAGYDAIMPTYNSLTSSQVKYLMAYLKSLSDVNQ